MEWTVLEQFAQGLGGDYKATLKRFLAIQALGSEGARQIVKTLNQHMQAYGFPDPKALQGGLDLLRNSSFVSHLTEIRQPSLLMFGRLDTLAPAIAAQPMQRAIPNSRSYVFEHGAHAPFISHPDEFVSVLQAFLTEKDDE
jgi:pimeloyl-[acyl-carrier protein] methyl ester esterase